MRRSLAAWLRSRRPVWILSVIGTVWSLGLGITELFIHHWSGAIVNGVIAAVYLVLLEWDRRRARRDRRLGIWMDDNRGAYTFAAGFEDEVAYRRAHDAFVVQQTERKEQAHALLLSVLTPHQRSVYEQEGYIPVLGSGGGEYKIYPYKTSNVKVRHKGATACAVTRGGSSLVEEQMLAQYLALVTDERAFLRVAILSFDRSIRY